jgi:hypothetical protein
MAKAVDDRDSPLPALARRVFIGRSVPVDAVAAASPQRNRGLGADDADEWLPGWTGQAGLQQAHTGALTTDTGVHKHAFWEGALMSQGKGNTITTFSAEDRPVVLLTLREAQALLDHFQPDPDGADDLSRAVRVLSNQVTYIKDRQS